MTRTIIVILSEDKGCVTIVMDKNDYSDKMNPLVNNKQTCKPLKCDPTPALPLRLNGKLLDLKKTETIDFISTGTVLQIHMLRITVS